MKKRVTIFFFFIGQRAFFLVERTRVTICVILLLYTVKKKPIHKNQKIYVYTYVTNARAYKKIKFYTHKNTRIKMHKKKRRKKREERLS